MVIERVSAMPKQGVSSSFRFGRGVGLIEGVIGASLVPVIYTAPATWKRFYGLPSDKETCRQRAVERWPESAAAFSRKRDHNRAEAAFIASWGLSARTVVGAVS